MLLEHVFLKVACDVILEVALASIKERNISNKMSAVVQIALLSLQCIGTNVLLNNNIMLLEHVFVKAAFDVIFKVTLAAIKLEHKEENVSCGPDCIALF